MLPHFLKGNRVASLLAIAVLVTVGFEPPGQAGAPVATSQRMEREGQLGGPISVVSTDGLTALVAEGESLARVDVTGEQPVLIASQYLGRGVIQDMVEAFPITYVLTEEGLLVMQGIQGQLLPQTTLFLPGGGQALALGQNTLYVAAREAGLRVFDVSVPQQARVIAQLTLAGRAIDVATTPGGEVVYVAAGEIGLHVITIQNPAEPVLLGTLDDYGAVESVTTSNSARGPLAHLATGNNVVTLSAPVGDNLDTMTLVGRYAPLSDGQRMAIARDFAFVADAQDGLKIFDVSVPGQLVQIYGESGNPAWDVALSPDGETAYLAAGGRGLRIVDVSNPYSPVERLSVALPGAAVGVGLSVDGDRALVALGDAGMAVVLTQSAGVVNVLPVEGQAQDSVTSQRWAYVATLEAGLQIVALNQPGAETVVAGLPLPGAPSALVLRGDTLFVAAGEAGLLAIDVLRPLEARLLGDIAPEAARQSYTDLVLYEKRAYVADGAGVAVLDVTGPAHMVHLTRRDLPGVRGLALSGGGLDVYLHATGKATIASHEVTISSDPLLLGIYDAQARIGSLASYGDQLLLAGAESGPALVVLNTANPAAPRETGHYMLSGAQASSSAAHDQLVLLAGGSGGLTRLTPDENGRLVATGAYAPLPEITHLAGGGDWLLAAGGRGWSLVSLQNPARPVPANRVGESLPIRALAYHDTRVVTLAGRLLASWDVSDPTQPVALQQRELAEVTHAVALDADTIYVAASTLDGAGQLDIYARDSLTAITRVPLPAAANAVTLGAEGRGVAYVALADGSLALVDVAEPTGGLLAFAALATDTPPLLAADGQRVVMLDGRQLSVLAVRANGLFRLEDTLLPRVGRHLALDGENLYVQSAAGEIDVYTLDENNRPHLNGRLVAASLAMVAGDGTLYVALGESGLAWLPPGADTLTPVPDSGPVTALTLDGQTLYAAGDSLSRYILVEDSLTLQASAPLSAPARAIAVSNATGDGPRWLYASTVNGFDVIRESGDTLEAVANVPISGGVGRIVPGGNRAYAAHGAGGLLVLNTADPAAPLPMFTYRSPAGGFVQDAMLTPAGLLVGWEGGLELLDAGRSASPPEVLALVPTGGAQALDVTLDGTLAYVSLGQDGIALVDIARPSEAALVSMLDTPGTALASAVESGMLFVADGTCGVRAIDVSDPAAPQERGFWLSGPTGDVLVSNGMLYAANGNALLALRYLPDAPPVAPPVPRDPLPANGQTGLPTTLELGWQPAADSCNPLRYDVAFGLPANPPLAGQVVGQPALDPGQLRGLTTYNWQVTATDLQGDVSTGPLWRFTTARGVGGGFISPDAPPIFADWLRDGWLPAAFAASGALGLLLWRRRGRKRG